MGFDGFLFRLCGVCFFLALIGYKMNGDTMPDKSLTMHISFLLLGFLICGFLFAALDTLEFIWKWLKGFF